MLSPEQLRAMAAADGETITDDRATGAANYSPAPKIRPADAFAKAVGYKPEGSTNSLKDRMGRLKSATLGDFSRAASTASFGVGERIGNAIGTSAAKLMANDDEKQFIDGDFTAGQIAGDFGQVAAGLLPVGRIAKGISTAAQSVGVGQKAAKPLANITTGLATGFGADVATNAAEGQEEVLKPGIGTAIGSIPLAGKVLQGAGRVAGEIAGKATGAGFGVLKEAMESAIAGGERAKAFRTGLRGNTSPEALVDEAKAGLGQVIKQRTDAYKAQLAKVVDSTKEFDATPVNAKFDELLEEFGATIKEDGAFDFERAPGLGRYKSDINDLYTTISNWGSREGDNTVAGIDKLKQTIDDFRIGSQDSKKFDKFVTTLRNTAKGLIKGEPGYDKLVTEYAESTEMIRDIEKGLSLGDKAMVETSFKKLTTALRQNNDFRAQFVKELDEATGGELLPKIAGQQLSEILPRGLVGALGPLAGGGALAGGVGVLPVIYAAIATSPRVIGEVINALGFTGEKAKKFIKALGGATGKIEAPGDYLLNQSSRADDAMPKNTSTNTILMNNISDTVPSNKTKSSTMPGYFQLGNETKDVSKLVDKANPYSKIASQLDNEDRNLLDTFINLRNQKKPIPRDLSDKVYNLVDLMGLDSNATDLTLAKQFKLIRAADNELSIKVVPELGGKVGGGSALKGSKN